MIQITPHMKVSVAVEPVDFRPGIDGLARLCREALRSDPFSGAVFAFRNRRGTSVKLLIYDGQGFWLCQKRLSSGRFRFWPTHVGEAVTALQAHELQVLLRGGDPSTTKASPEWRSVAVLQATIYEMERLRCNLCGKVFDTESPPGVGDKKYDPTAARMIGLLKYGTGVPFNRLERLEGNLGIPLPASTQWDIVSGAAGEMTPVLDELIRQAAQGWLVHNDDTSMRVLELRKRIDELKKAGETDRTEIFLTSIVAELADGHRVALFFTGNQHAGENLADVLAQRAAELDKPMQMCDASDNNLPKDFKTIVGNCLAHARRKFVEVVDSFPDQCRHVLETLRDVYVHDATARERGMSDEDRLSYHQQHSGPLMAELEQWMLEQIDQKIVEPNSTLGKSFTYMTKRWDRLTLFLREPGAPLDNTRPTDASVRRGPAIAERALKKAILHRRNSLFYKTENGAKVGDIFMTLIHTAELAGANPFDYLTALLSNPEHASRDPAQRPPWNYETTRDRTQSSSTASV